MSPRFKHTTEVIKRGLSLCEAMAYDVIARIGPRLVIDPTSALQVIERVKGAIPANDYVRIIYWLA